MDPWDRKVLVISNKDLFWCCKNVKTGHEFYINKNRLKEIDKAKS
jgi:hypothetical protein